MSLSSESEGRSLSLVRRKNHLSSSVKHLQQSTESEGSKGDTLKLTADRPVSERPTLQCFDLPALFYIVHLFPSAHLGSQLLSHLRGQRLCLCLLRGQGAGRACMQGLLQVEQAKTLGSEAQVKEGVKKRVEAAVNVGQAGGVGVSQQQEAQKGTGARKQLKVREGVSTLQYVEGYPAGGKHHYQHGDDLQQPPLTLVLFAQSVEVASDGAADEAVAHHHRQER